MCIHTSTVKGPKYELKTGRVELRLRDIPKSFIGLSYIAVVREVIMEYWWMPIGLFRSRVKTNYTFVAQAHPRIVIV